MTVTVDPMPPATLVELVNGWGTAPRTARCDGGEDAYLTIAELFDRLGAPPSVGRVFTDHALTAVADRLHPVFATADGTEQARLVTAFLDGARVRPVLNVMAGHPHAGWIVDDPEDAVLASAAVTLRRHLAEHGSGRLGVCTGRRCADVFVDASPGGRRRFCSVTCQNRARVAAFRSRRASTK
jgi:predicted RNA-binding Zn ribbon-like protein